MDSTAQVGHRLPPGRYVVLKRRHGTCEPLNLYNIAEKFDTHFACENTLVVWLDGQQVLAWLSSIQPQQRVAVWTNSSTVQSSRESGSCWLLLTERWAQAANRQANSPFFAVFWWLVIINETQSSVGNVPGMKPPPPTTVLCGESLPQKGTRLLK